MADSDQSLYNIRYNQVTQGMEGFGGGTPQWTPLTLVADGGINQLTGDVHAGPGTGSQAATLATVNSNVGSFTSANITVDAKGRITAAANGSAGSGTVNSGTATQVAYYATTGTAVSSTTAFLRLAGGNGAVLGTAVADDAAPGYVGEWMQSYADVGSIPASGTFGDAVSINLTAGDWDVSALLSIDGVDTTRMQFGISTTPGNSGAGLNYGDNFVDGSLPNGTTNGFASIPSWRWSSAGSATLYAKIAPTYTTTPDIRVRISARRVR